MNNHGLRVYESILGLLSNEDNPTPLVRLNRVVPYEHTQVYAKLEWYNPFGSVKDRVANNLLADAERRGVLGDVRKLVEPTSGNTGMGLAMLSNAKGYRLTTPLSKAIPVEKRTVLRFFGCDVIELEDTLCPAPGAPEGAIAKATELSEQPDFHMLNQYVNEANPDAHYRTTGPEIWKQTQGRVTHFVAGLGTCGSITGTGRFLKERSSAVQVLGVHPQEGHDIPGVRSLKQLSQTKLFRPDEYDRTIEIDNQTSYDLCARLNQEESLIAGPSSAMALAGAFQMVPDAPGNVLVVMFPDNVFKYATSIRKHQAHMFGQSTESSSSSPMFDQMLEYARFSSDVIGASELQEQQRHGATLIDVRSGKEFEAEHIEGATNIPLDELDPAAPALPADRNTRIVTVCAVGKRSLRGMLLLKSMGYNNVRNLEGGMKAWNEAGLPAVRPAASVAVR